MDFAVCNRPQETRVDLESKMIRRRFGGLTSIEVPVIGQGTWQIDSGVRAATLETLRYERTFL
jgi:hypothetical protein